MRAVRNLRVVRVDPLEWWAVHLERRAIHEVDELALPVPCPACEQLPGLELIECFAECERVVHEDATLDAYCVQQLFAPHVLVAPGLLKGAVRSSAVRVHLKRVRKVPPVTSTAPWWATGVFSLGGVVIAQLVAWVINRSRSRFEDSRRWHEDRRDIYLDIVTNSWRIQDAVFEHFEGQEPLPDDLERWAKDLEEAGVKTQLVGSEKIIKMTQTLVRHGHAAVAASRAGQSGPGLDACDGLRHTLYACTDTMRGELTANRALERHWNSNTWRRRRRRLGWKSRDYTTPDLGTRKRSDRSRTAPCYKKSTGRLILIIDRPRRYLLDQPNRIGPSYPRKRS